MITFAKRRLRLSELREAIGIISCSDPRALKRHSIPWQQAVKKLFAPLIETQPDPKNADDCFCHLFHGTVRDFLLKNQDIFRLGQTVVTNRLVSEMVIAEACLLYLSQEKYSQLLAKRSSQWVTTLGEDLSDHHLLTYSAKYWDKHLDDVQETPQLLYRIEKFLTSSNFQTTLQIQSLCVEGHFGLYTVQGHAGSHKFTKRVFPRWFCENKSGETTDFLGNYRSFISEWQSFLDSATCNDGCCEHMHYARYIGELDRCLWKALGPSNFLSSNHGRYCSFMLTNEQNPLKRHTKLYQDCVTWDGSLVVVLQCATGRLVYALQNRYPWQLDRAYDIYRDELGTPVSEESSPYRLEFWSMPNHTAPTFLTEELLFTGLDPTKWKTCGRALRESQQSTSFKTVSFSPDLSYLRIGSKVFSKDSSGGYVAIDGLDLTADNMSACFEEITNRARFLVLASRRSMPKPSLNRGRMTDGDASIERGPDSTNAHLEPKLTGVDCGHCSRDPSRSKNGSDTSSPNAANEASSDSDSADASSSSSSESLDCNSAEETWSEGSSDISQLEQVQWRTLDSSEDETSATSESESETDVESDIEDSSEGPVHSYGQLLDESESDGGDIDFGCGSEDDAYQADSDCSDSSDYSKINDDLGFDSGDEDAMHTRLFYKALSQPRVKYPKGCLMIYDLSSNPPNLLFRFSQTLPLMLFDSPPAIHPTQPLVVWPLSGGDILFADFEAKTYFTRRARPSTRRSIISLIQLTANKPVLTSPISSPRLRKMQILLLRTLSAYSIPRGTRNAPLQSRKKETCRTLFGALGFPFHPPALNTQNHPQPAVTDPPRQNLTRKHAEPQPRQNARRGHLVPYIRVPFQQQRLQFPLPLSRTAVCITSRPRTLHRGQNPNRLRPQTTHPPPPIRPLPQSPLLPPLPSPRHPRPHSHRQLGRDASRGPQRLCSRRMGRHSRPFRSSIAAHRLLCQRGSGFGRVGREQCASGDGAGERQRGLEGENGAVRARG